MLNVTAANMGELAVVGCEGRIVQSAFAYKLREAVTSQTDAGLSSLNSRKCVPSEAAVLACSRFCNDGRGNTTSGSCYSILPSQSRAD
jgi:hypothetical protein